MYPPRQHVASIDSVEKAVAAAFGSPPETLHRDGHHAGIAKVVAVELACRLTGKSQREVGRYFGYTSESSVSKQRRKCRELCRGDRALSVQIEGLKQQILDRHSPIKV